MLLYLLLVAPKHTCFACLPFFSVSMDTNSQKSERRGMMIQSLLQFLLVLKGLRFWRINAVEFYVCKKLLHTFLGESAEYIWSWVVILLYCDCQGLIFQVAMITLRQISEMLKIWNQAFRHMLYTNSHEIWSFTSWTCDDTGDCSIWSVFKGGLVITYYVTWFAASYFMELIGQNEGFRKL